MLFLRICYRNLIRFTFIMTVVNWNDYIVRCPCEFSYFSLHMWISYGIAAISPFSHRLAFDNMPEDIQRLRCKVNFQALTFVPHIRALGDALVSRLQYPFSRNEPEHGLLHQYTYKKREPQKFVVLHLRFDKVWYFSLLQTYWLCVLPSFWLYLVCFNNFICAGYGCPFGLRFWWW